MLFDVKLLNYIVQPSRSGQAICWPFFYTICPVFQISCVETPSNNNKVLFTSLIFMRLRSLGQSQRNQLKWAMPQIPPIMPLTFIRSALQSEKHICMYVYIYYAIDPQNNPVHKSGHALFHFIDEETEAP